MILSFCPSVKTLNNISVCAGLVIDNQMFIGYPICSKKVKI